MKIDVMRVGRNCLSITVAAAAGDLFIYHVRYERFPSRLCPPHRLTNDRLGTEHVDGMCRDVIAD